MYIMTQRVRYGVGKCEGTSYSIYPPQLLFGLLSACDNTGASLRGPIRRQARSVCSLQNEPAEGAFSKLVTQIVLRSASRFARSRSLDQTVPPRPVIVSFARRIHCLSTSSEEQSGLATYVSLCQHTKQGLCGRLPYQMLFP